MNERDRIIRKLKRAIRTLSKSEAHQLIDQWHQEGTGWTGGKANWIRGICGGYSQGLDGIATTEITKVLAPGIHATDD